MSWEKAAAIATILGTVIAIWSHFRRVRIARDQQTTVGDPPERPEFPIARRLRLGEDFWVPVVAVFLLVAVFGGIFWAKRDEIFRGSCAEILRGLPVELTEAREIFTKEFVGQGPGRWEGQVERCHRDPEGCWAIDVAEGKRWQEWKTREYRLKPTNARFQVRTRLAPDDLRAGDFVQVKANRIAGLINASGVPVEADTAENGELRVVVEGGQVERLNE